MLSLVVEAGKRLLQQTFHMRHLDASAMKGKESVSLHVIQGTTDIKTAVTHLGSQLRHEDMKGLGACGMNAAVGHETDDAFTERLWTMSPWLVQQFLGARGQEVQQVDAEDEKLLGQSHHLRAMDTQQRHRCQRPEGVGVALLIAEDRLGLQHERRRELLGDGVSAIVGTRVDSHRTREEKAEMITDVAIMIEYRARRQLLEVELRMAGYLTKVVTAHTQKEWELQQLVEEYHFSILSRSEGENQTSLSPLGVE